MAMPVLCGQKTESEKFPGAVRTYAIEAMMQDKKALQAGTSHMLGQNFAKMFDTQFQGRDGKQHYAWQTSWGVSTRLIGALILTHSDDFGLVVPPKLAATHAVIIIIGKAEERAKVKEQAIALQADLRKAGVRTIVDDDESKGPGFKYAEYDLQGICLRIELGPKDLEKNQCVMVRRDQAKGKETPKAFVPLADAVAMAQSSLDAMQKGLLQKARDFRAANTHEVNSYDEMKKRADDGFLLAHWNGDAKIEAKIKEETGLTTRNRPFDLKQEPGKCVVTGEPSPGRIVFSKAY
jgi:prolyl-tRNA synthetase